MMSIFRRMSSTINRWKRR